MLVAYHWSGMMQAMTDRTRVKALLREWHNATTAWDGKLPNTWEAYLKKYHDNLRKELPEDVQGDFAAWEEGWENHLCEVALLAFCEGTALYLRDCAGRELEEDFFEKRVWRKLYPLGLGDYAFPAYSDRSYQDCAEWLHRIESKPLRATVMDDLRRLCRGWKARERGVAGCAFYIGYYNGEKVSGGPRPQPERMNIVAEEAGVTGAFAPERPA